MVIEKYEHVMHIVSEVKGKIKKDISPMTGFIYALNSS
jgi:anthranilate synthase component 1